MRSVIMAFSMYSRIPMPKIKWDEKRMQYSLCFFPLVGLTLGGCGVLLYFICERLHFQSMTRALLQAALPILLTGGIHMDGYLDVTDAKNSWKPAEEKLKILKDPHIGAFACIYAIIYLMLTTAFMNEITFQQTVHMAVCYTYSRILSGLSVVWFRKAKKDGMVAENAKSSAPGVKWILIVELVLCISVLLLMGCALPGSFGMGNFALRNFLPGLVSTVLGLACFFRYRHMAYKTFGGTTGDLAGYFLQACELLMLIGTVCSGCTAEVL